MSKNVRAEQGGIAFGDNAQNNTINEIDAIRSAIQGEIGPFIELQTKFNVTTNALHTFFGIIKRQSLPEDEWPQALEHIAKKHLEAIKVMDALQCSTPEHQAKLEQAKEALTEGRYHEQRELLLIVAKAEKVAAEDAEAIEQQAQQAKVTRMLNSAAIYDEIAKSHNIELNYKEALTNYEQAIEQLSELKDTTSEISKLLSYYQNEAGILCQALSFIDKAVHYLELTLESHLKILDEDHPDVAIARNNLGSVWHDKGDYDKAIAYYELALKSNLKTFGEDHPNVALGRNNLGSVWQNKGDYDLAIANYELALKSDLKTFDENHPNVAIVRNNLGSVWHDKGDCDKAIAYYELALKSDLKTFGEGHPNVAIGRNNLGSAWQDKGDYGKAIAYYEQALKSHLVVFGESHINVATIRNNIGSAWRYKGDYGKAIKYIEQSLQGIQKILGDNHPKTQISAGNLAYTKWLAADKKSK